MTRYFRIIVWCPFCQLFCGLCVLLIILTGALWLRSFWTLDDVTYYRQGTAGNVGLISSRGRMSITDSWFDRWEIGSADQTFYHEVRAPEDLFAVSGPGVGTRRMLQAGGITFVLNAHEWIIVLPYVYLVLIIGSLLIGNVAMRIWRRRLGRIGCCNYCGYDLRATPDRCPECGTTPGSVR